MSRAFPRKASLLLLLEGVPRGCGLCRGHPCPHRHTRTHSGPDRHARGHCGPVRHARSGILPFPLLSTKHRLPSLRFHPPPSSHSPPSRVTRTMPHPPDECRITLGGMNGLLNEATVQ